MTFVSIQCQSMLARISCLFDFMQPLPWFLHGLELYHSVTLSDDNADVDFDDDSTDLNLPDESFSSQHANSVSSTTCKGSVVTIAFLCAFTFLSWC